MRIGLAIGLHGGPEGGERETPRWHGIRERARAAEAAGFDLVVIEDALLFSGPPAKIAEQLLAFGELGIGEVRCNLYHPRGDIAVLDEAIPAMREVVQALHAA